MAYFGKQWLRQDRRKLSRSDRPAIVDLAVNLTGLSQDEWLHKHEVLAWLSIVREPRRDVAQSIYLTEKDVDAIIAKLLSVATKEQKVKSFVHLARDLPDKIILDKLAESRKL